MATERGMKNQLQTVHADRGINYSSAEFRLLLEQRRITLSMGRNGDCLVNAVSKDYFASCNKEFCCRLNFLTHRETDESLFDYIQAFYNPTPAHSKSGHFSPADNEQPFASDAR